MQNLKASKNPLQDIDRASYLGQDPKRKQFREGYQWFMNKMPAIDTTIPVPQSTIQLSKYWMEVLANDLGSEKWITEKQMEPNTFERTIVAIEEPDSSREGAEIVVAQWGTGFSSPVHGHAVGYIHEAILSGRVRVNTYRMVDQSSNVVRPVRTDIVNKGTFASVYNAPNPSNKFARQALIHNFTALETTSTLHFLPEHTRDGRDNRFEVEHFDQVHPIFAHQVMPVSGKDAMYAQKGDVFIVRSPNVPEYGDHYIVITGAPVVKEHGLRPQDIAIQAVGVAELLDQYQTFNGLILLKLDKTTTKRFHEFHGITVDNGDVIFQTT